MKERKINDHRQQRQVYLQCSEGKTEIQYVKGPVPDEWIKEKRMRVCEERGGKWKVLPSCCITLSLYCTVCIDHLYPLYTLFPM